MAEIVADTVRKVTRLTAVIEGLILVALVFDTVELFSRWFEAREDRCAQLLAESWTIYRASRVGGNGPDAPPPPSERKAKRARQEAMEPRGIEPLTFGVPRRRSPS
jgi:hypothetical protein